MDRNLFVHQPAYIPWLPYFARLLQGHAYVSLDHVQFCERGWQHRNRISAPDGRIVTLTVPVLRKGRFPQCLATADIADRTWIAKHTRTLSESYGSAPFGHLVDDFVDAVLSPGSDSLVDVAHRSIDWICDALDVLRIRHCSSDVRNEAPPMNRTATLIELCHSTRCSGLIVGEGAMNYLDKEACERAELRLISGVDSRQLKAAAQGLDESGREVRPDLSSLDSIFRFGPTVTRRWIQAALEVADGSAESLRPR